jgi:hypothetical protein
VEDLRLKEATFWRGMPEEDRQKRIAEARAAHEESLKQYVPNRHS